MAKDAHLFSRLESSAARGWFAEADARASLGAPVAEVGELFRQGVAHMRPSVRATAEPAYDISLAVLGGHLGDAIAAVQRREAASVGDDDAGGHLSAAYALARLQIETGDPAAAGKTAAAAHARWRVWGAPRWLEQDLRPALVAIEARAGLLAPAEAARLVDAWDAEWHERLHDDSGPGVVNERWAVMHATGVTTPDEATEALRLVKPGDPGSLGIWPMTSAAPYGRTLLLAGRVDEAIPYLQRTAADCEEARSTLSVFAARYDLGEALASKGDTKGACDAWREIVFRWGDAKPRSITAEAAKTGMRALGCLK
jgi:serine/threonine-protein kinase